MPRIFKNLACLALLTLTGQVSWGFALLGPQSANEPWQVTTIGYFLPGDIGGPRNLGEEYRHNTPVMYYSYDANFLDYFASNGVVAVDSAIAILNGVTNVSKLSPNLNEYPVQATRENFLAESLGLLDLKSLALESMVEQMGLGEPERWAWTLHDRVQIPGFPRPCPEGYVYSVIMRNFDPVPSPSSQLQATPYVNGTLYSYFINEVCVTPDPLGQCIPFPVDPLDFTFTAIASRAVGLGQFHTGLTRDDVGGLRYLLTPQNFNFEGSGSNTLAQVTNPVPQLLFTSNLTQFAEIASTNDPVTLLTFFPTLSIITSSNYFVNGLVTNVTQAFTNYPWSPAGSTTLITVSNVVPIVQTRWVHTFGNLLVLSGPPSHPTLKQLTQLPAPNGKAFITIETDKIGTAADPFAPVGTITITTNSTFSTFLTNAVVGDYVILPTNICAVEIINTQLTYVTLSTNFIGSVTNSLIITNSAGFTNAGTTLVVSQSQINYFTNHVFTVLQANCVPNGPALFGGIDRISFVRRDFDSLLGRFFQPITNNYVLKSITNNIIVAEPIQRTVTSPDFLFSAADLANGPAVYPPGAAVLARSNNWNATFAYPNLAGPGTIDPPGGIVFDKVGPIYFNTYLTAFSPDTAQAAQQLILALGSFDGTTNLPIVYPNGTSVANLINQALIGISPSSLPNGRVGLPYDAGTPTFTAQGGQTPYTWALVPGSPALPPGLFLQPNGTLGGTPTQEGTFDFTIMLTDGGGRTVVHPYFITILP
jgi:Putative Ig domain